MKRKKICLFGVMACFSLILMGCNNDDSSSPSEAPSAPSEDTTETLFLEWKAGRDAFSTYEGEHTFVDTDLYYEDGVLTSKTINKGGRKGKEFYSINEEYSLDDDNVLTKDSTSIEAIKQITVEGKERTKLYHEASSSEGTMKEGSYISPNYTSELYSMILQEHLEDYYISSGDSYSALIQNINEAAMDDFDAEPTSVSLNRKENGAVSLSMHFVGEYVNEFFKNENDEGFNIYVKLVLPKDSAAVVTVFQNIKRSWVFVVYLVDIGATFNRIEYDILSIDGKEWKEGDSKDIQITENRAYVVVYNTPNLAG